MQSKQIARNSQKTLVRQILSMLLQLVSMIFIARQLGAAGNGLYALALLLPTFLATTLSFGLSSAIVYYIKTEEFATDVVYTTSFIKVIAIATFGVIAGFYIITYYAENLFPNVPAAILMLSLLIFPLTLFNAVQLAFIHAKEDFNAYNIVWITQPLFFLGVISIFYLLATFTLANVILGFIGSLVVTMLLTLFFTYTKGFRFNIQAFSRLYLKKSLSYGLRSHASNVIAFINDRAAIFILNLFTSAAVVGIYYIAIGIAEKLWIISISMSSVLLPRFVALNNNIKQRNALIAKSFQIVILLTLILSLCLIVFGYFLIEIIFGAEFASAYFAILLLIPGIVLGAGSRILANAIAAKGKPEFNAYTAIFTMVFNICLNVILIPKYGILGAAFATSLAYSINTILRIWLFKFIEKSFELKQLMLHLPTLHLIKNEVIKILK